MTQFNVAKMRFVGTGGSLKVPDEDEISLKLAMLIEGECGHGGPKAAAKKYGYSRQRYFQLRSAFFDKGADMLWPYITNDGGLCRRTTVAQ